MLALIALWARTFAPPPIRGPQCLTNVAVIGPVEDNYRRGEPINHLVQAPDEAVAELPHSP
jgi:hypothetical protein